MAAFPTMLRTDYIASYRATLQALLAAHGEKEAMELIVGGQAEAIGVLEISALRTLGLDPQHSVVDIGCGSGRLAVKLAPWLRGKYWGVDILPELTAYAAKACGRADWEFGQTDGYSVRVPDGVADFVCFFSVFTHLEYDDMYHYLAEAKRLLRPGGRVVFSYLDLGLPSHWPIFETVLANRNENRVLNQFISKEALRAMGARLGLQEERFYDGPETWIRLESPITYADGRRVEGVVEFGQSVGVLRRP